MERGHGGHLGLRGQGNEGTGSSVLSWRLLLRHHGVSWMRGWVGSQVYGTCCERMKSMWLLVSYQDQVFRNSSALRAAYHQTSSHWW